MTHERGPRSAWSCVPAGVLLGVVACAPPRELALDPAPVVFTPAATERTLTIENRGAQPLALAAVRLDSATPDWGSFVLTDARLPATIPARGSVALHLSADTEHFVGERVYGQPPRYRQGHARLLFTADGPRSVDLRFEPEPPGAAARDGIKLALFAAIVGGLARLGRRRERAPWLLLSTILLLPWAAPLCFGALGADVGLAAQAQCAAGHGGVALTLASPPGGVAWILALVIVGALVDPLAALRGPAPATELRVAGRRALADLALLLGIAPALLASATLDLGDLVARQAVGGWQVLHHPVAAIVCLFAVALRDPRGGPRRDEDLALAALLAALFLGGWTLPVDPAALAGLSHAGLLEAGLLVHLAKIASLLGGVTLLRRRLLARRREPSRGLAPLVLLALLALVVAVVLGPLGLLGGAAS
ncbi:MAG: hypothetical protein R3A79_09915 [Nannocystaceae bacterium]